MASIIIAVMLISSMPQAVIASDYDNHWARQAIDNYKDKGVIQGFEDGTFRPKELITRAQFAKIMNGIFSYSAMADAKQYNDVATGK